MDQLDKPREEIKLIGEIDFKDIKVKVYHDPYSDKNDAGCTWQMRNPSSCYQGHVFMNWETRKITYPEGAIIPEQTDEDREILPKFIVTGYEIIDDKFISFINLYLESDYKRRNGVKK